MGSVRFVQDLLSRGEDGTKQRDHLNLTDIKVGSVDLLGVVCDSVGSICCRLQV